MAQALPFPFCYLIGAQTPLKMSHTLWVMHLGISCLAFPKHVAEPTLNEKLNKRAVSGKKKAHKHKSFWPVTVQWGGGVSWSGVQGSKIYVLSLEPKEKHKCFCPGARPGRPVTGVTEKSFMCKSFACLFFSLQFARLLGGAFARLLGGVLSCTV